MGPTEPYFCWPSGGGNDPRPPDGLAGNQWGGITSADIIPGP